ncbi:MAG: hypothetical protein ABH817_01445 [archaeon]
MNLKTLFLAFCLVLPNCSNNKTDAYQAEIAKLEQEKGGLELESRYKLDSLNIERNVLENLLCKTDTTMARVVGERLAYIDSTEMYRLQTQKLYDILVSFTSGIREGINSSTCILESLATEIVN